MNWIIDMARRNIKRNKRRTILAASSIALAVMLMTFLGGLVSGILDNMVRNLTRSDMGHVRIVTQGFVSRSRFMPVDELVPDPDAVMAAIRAIPDLPGTLVTTTDRIMFGDSPAIRKPRLTSWTLTGLSSKAGTSPVPERRYSDGNSPPTWALR